MYTTDCLRAVVDKVFCLRDRDGRWMAITFYILNTLSLFFVKRMGGADKLKGYRTVNYHLYARV